MIRAALDRLRHIWRVRHWDHARSAGRRGEDLAHRFLQRQGFIVVARNYRMASGSGEADLIAWERSTLALVEVKSRESGEFGPPERAIGEEKRMHMQRVARDYAAKSGTPWEQVRLDVVTVLLTRPPAIQLFRGAVKSS
ncbi:MAG TPA: YraN family protein [Bryobacteraceae bacterium]|jgi:putative endonuclease